MPLLQALEPMAARLTSFVPPVIAKGPSIRTRSGNDGSRPTYSESDSPVEVILEASRFVLTRAGMSTGVQARPGDFLFAGDRLDSGGGQVTVLNCARSELAASASGFILRGDGALSGKATRGTGRSADKPITFDSSSSTIWIATNMPTGIIIGNDASTISFPSAVFDPKVIKAGDITFRDGFLKSAQAPFCMLPPVSRSTQAATTAQVPAAPADLTAALARLPADSRGRIQMMTDALARDPNDLPTLMSRGATLQEYGLIPEAIADYRLLNQKWSSPALAALIGELELNTDRSDIQAAPRPGKTLALVMGISQYQRLQPDRNLQFADRDAQSFADFLRTPRGGGLPAEDMYVLTNEQATSAGIRNALNAVLTVAGRSDTFILYFSGHTAQQGQANQFLVTYDSDAQDFGATAIPESDVVTALKRSHAGRILVFVDSDHADTFTNIGDGRFFILTATGPGQTAYESANFGGGHGAFTYFLLRALNGDADAGNNRLISIDEIYRYVFTQVRNATSGKQIPTMSSGFPRLYRLL
jgi:hypothetical protein